MGYSPWGHKESDTTERLHFHFSLSCIGEGNGNPLQCSCLENPRDRGAWWAAVYGVTQSWTRLKRLSSSSSSRIKDRKSTRLNSSHVATSRMPSSAPGDFPTQSLNPSLLHCQVDSLPLSHLGSPRPTQSKTLGTGSSHLG